MYELKSWDLGKTDPFTVNIFMFKYMNNDLPDVFKRMFSYRHEIYAYNTRGANQLHLEQFPTNKVWKDCVIVVLHYGIIYF